VAISPGPVVAADWAAGGGFSRAEGASSSAVAARASLRLALVVESTFAGVARHVADLAEGLLQRHHEVHLVYSTLRMEAYFRERIAALRGLKTSILDVDRAPSLRDGQSISRLRAYLKTAGPFDVVHGHSSKAGAIARLAAAGLGVSRVYTPNAFRTADPELGLLEHCAYALVERTLGRLASDVVIVVSPEEFDEALQIGIPKERLRLIINGARMPSLRPRQEVRRDLGLRSDDLLLLFVGRLVPQKGADRFVEIFAQVAGTEPNLKGVVIGSGAMERQLWTRIRQLGLEDRLCLMASQEAVQFMPGADVLVVTSRYEGMPYTLIEAQYVGLPIVAFRAGGVSTAIADGKTGFICEQDDTDGLVSALRRLARDPILRQRMGLAARDRAPAFDLDCMVDATEALYQELRLERRSTRGHTLASAGRAETGPGNEPDGPKTRLSRHEPPVP
jgi:glycosyltransferase involved in cell wall biosynthesis